MQSSMDRQAVWTNWAGNQRFEPNRTMSAESEADVIRAVELARGRNLGVRTFGSGHSFTPIVETDGILLDTSGLKGVLSIDVDRQNVTAWSHTTIAELGEPLWQVGLAVRNQGDIDSQTIAGAVATSTHGSGLNFGSFSAGLVACRLVDRPHTLRPHSLSPGGLTAPTIPVP